MWADDGLSKKTNPGGVCCALTLLVNPLHDDVTRDHLINLKLKFRITNGSIYPHVIMMYLTSQVCT